MQGSGHAARSMSTLAYEEVISTPRQQAAGGHKQAHSGHHGHQHGQHGVQAHAGAQDQSNMPTVLVLHGLLGSARNWRSVAKRLGDALAATSHTPWRTLALDLRCHGSSARISSLTPPHSMEAAAGDVADFITHKLGGHAPVGILGHSMGGKVLLSLLQQLGRPDAGAQRGLLPAQAWVLDSQPGVVPEGLDDQTGVAQVLRAVHEVPLPIPSRAWLTDHLKTVHKFDNGIIQWLGSSLVPHVPHGHGGGGASGPLTWAFNAQGAAAMYASYKCTDYWGVLHAPPTAVHLVRGGKSDRWPQPILSRLEQVPQGLRKAGDAPSDAGGSFHVHVLPKAGHWLHVDDTEGMVNLLVPRLVEAASKHVR